MENHTQRESSDVTVVGEVTELLSDLALRKRWDSWIVFLLLYSKKINELHENLN
jgi:hypothetical protein